MTCKRIDHHKINDASLQSEWEILRLRVQLALRRLNDIKPGPIGDPTNLDFFEAVNDYSDARDRERTFFWDNFLMSD